MGLFIILLFIGLIFLFFYFRNANQELTHRLNKLERDLFEVIAPESESAEEKEPVAILESEPEPTQEPPPLPPKPELTYKKVSIPEPPEEQVPKGPILETEPPVQPEKSEPAWSIRWREFKENVDWEQFTGKKVSAWLGGLSLFIAAGFFIKLSIERDWIPMGLRLAIGAVMGILLIIISSRFKQARYTIMRHTLVSCGIGILYAVVYATNYYEYITKPVGFALLTLISAAAFVLAVYHRGVAISILGALGAYATPIIVSTGSSSIVMLFGYLAIVNIGAYLVVRYLQSQILLLIATVGTMLTLALGMITNYHNLPGYTISGVWIANLTLFSLFLGLSNIDPKKNLSIKWAGIILYVSTLFVALILLDKPGWATLSVITASTFGAVALAYRNRGWYARVIPFSAVAFPISFLWTIIRFSPQHFNFSFILFLLYGVAGGLGPIWLIWKYGLDKDVLHWFKTFPIAVVAISLIGFFKAPISSFWFWPILLCLQLAGIGISLLISAFIQVGVLILLFIAGALFWIFHAPADVIGFGFFGFVLFAGMIICLAIFLFMKKGPDLIASLKLDEHSEQQILPSDFMKGFRQWLTAAPALGAFVLLGAAFTVKHPLFPHPGMVTLICFLALTLLFSIRIGFQAPSVVAILASIGAQSIWIMNPTNNADILFSSIVWSSALFLGALIIPFLTFRDLEKWKQIINAWALFEIVQGIFILYASSLYWDNHIVKWTPLILAMVKLPVVAILLRRLEGKEGRNAILAFHGGALLFYISALPVLVLDHGWIGLAFMIEASALLWLNQRIEHPGLRSVATFLAPIGLLILVISVPKLKGVESLPIFNSAILSVAVGIIALGMAVKYSAFPKREHGTLDLPNYFLWIAVGTGFYFLNLIIADLFGGTGKGFDIIPGRDFLHSACYALTWTAFGAILWRLGRLPLFMRTVGLIFSFIGGGWLILIPIIFPETVAAMKPLFNMGLVTYLPLMAILYFLFFKEPLKDSKVDLKNVFLAVFLVAGFLLIQVEFSTLFQTGMNFELIRPHTASKAVASAAGWLLYGLGLLLWPKRLDRPFRIAGVALIGLGILKTILFPFRFRAEFGDMIPIINIPSLLFLFLISSLIYLTLRTWKQPWPFPQLPSRPFWGIVLAIVTFIILNIEIAGAFAIKGRAFSMLSHGSLSMQLAYSIGWLVFSIGLMVVGIKWDTIKVRWAAIILLVITALKIFALDLWKLGNWYRVGAFFGLAVVLIMISFLYQRFLSEGKNNEK